MTHAKQPRICEKCRTAIERQSAQTAFGYDAKFCKHRGGGLAIVVIQNGAIIDWTLNTCVDEATATRKINAVRDDARNDILLGQSLPDTKH
jgi:hypothetical protein